MKTLAPSVSVIEVPAEGMLALLGQQVEVRCNVYIYAGKLVGVNDNCIKLDNAAVVYETGAFSAPSYKDAQHIGDGQYVMLGLIESFGPTSKKY